MISYAQKLFSHTIFRDDYNRRTRCRYFIGFLLIWFILTTYINMNKLQKPFNSSKPFLIINSTESPLVKVHGPPYLAMIIASNVKRFNFTLSNLNTMLPGYFNINHKQPVSHNDSRFINDVNKHVLSLLLTYIDIWKEFGMKSENEFTDNDWIFLFEDDVNIVPMTIIESFYPQLYAKWDRSNPNSSIAGIIEQGLKLAKHDGILYLGTCGAEYVDNITMINYSADGLFQFRRGIYFCTHAIAYTKWRARKIWNDFDTYRLTHIADGSDIIANEWQKSSKIYPVSIAANIHWPPGTGHHGLFYQDRGAVASIIQGHVFD